MSKVYSFRLDVDNPREAQAKKIIKIWGSKGYSLRHLVTDALISFENQRNDPDEMQKILDQLLTLLNNKESELRQSTEDKNDTSLSPNFLEAVKRDFKEGVKSRM